ncbi:MAG: NERD domain-containing protein [Planctomycetota bacterium]
MAQTKSEKIVGDTLRKLQKDGEVLWGYKMEAQLRGQYRTPAPLDFLVVLADGTYVPIEVKEQTGLSIPWGHWKEEQRRLLRELPNAMMLLRYTADLTRASLNYWDFWWLVAGAWAPPPGGSGGGVKLSSIRDQDQREGAVQAVAAVVAGTSQGLDEGVGLSTRGNPTKGLPSLLPAIHALL